MTSSHKSMLVPFVPFPEKLVSVRIVKRLNRFVIRVEAVNSDRSPMLLHLPNSGRMQELLTPGALGMAALSTDPSRKTAGTLLLVRNEGRWVSVDARMPNHLLDQCLTDQYLPPFRGYHRWQSEVAWGKGRIDFKLTAMGKPDFLIETKSCNLVENGIALFPDAPTIRGTRHLTELAAAVKQGYKAAVVWFVQRDDASHFAPHRKADPDFAHALTKAVAIGVEAHAYRCRVSPKGIAVLDAIPICTRLTTRR